MHDTWVVGPRRWHTLPFVVGELTVWAELSEVGLAEVSGDVWAVTEDMTEVAVMVRGGEEVLAAVRGGKGQRSISKKSQFLAQIQPRAHRVVPSSAVTKFCSGLPVPSLLSHNFMKSSSRYTVCHTIVLGKRLLAFCAGRKSRCDHIHQRRWQKRVLFCISLDFLSFCFLFFTTR